MRPRRKIPIAKSNGWRREEEAPRRVPSEEGDIANSSRSSRGPAESRKTSSTHVETGITYRRYKPEPFVLACVLSRVHTVALTNNAGTVSRGGRLRRGPI